MTEREIGGVTVGRPIRVGGTQAGRSVVVEGPGTLLKLSHRHVQDVPADIWLIFHDLTFTPSGIWIEGSEGQRLYPLQVRHPQLGRTRIDFRFPVSGTADLS